jgi:hypothetical protein
MRKPNSNPAIYAIYFYKDGSKKRFDFQRSTLTQAEAASSKKAPAKKPATKKAPQPKAEPVGASSN